MNVNGMNNVSFKARMVRDPELTEEKMKEILAIHREEEKIKFQKAVDSLTSPEVQEKLKAIGTDKDTLVVNVEPVFLHTKYNRGGSGTYLYTDIVVSSDITNSEGDRVFKWNCLQKNSFDCLFSIFLEKFPKKPDLTTKQIVEKIFNAFPPK